MTLLSEPYLPNCERFKQCGHLGTLEERFETCSMVHPKRFKAKMRSTLQVASKKILKQRRCQQQNNLSKKDDSNKDDSSEGDESNEDESKED